MWIGRSQRKKNGAHTVSSSVADETISPFKESARNCLKFVCDGIPACSTWKSDLVKNLGCFYYSVIFCLLQKQAAACFGSFFHSFSVLGWVANELRAVHREQLLHFCI